MIIIGIDPGLAGAVAVIYPDGRLVFYDTPILTVGEKKQYDLPQMVRILRDARGLKSMSFPEGQDLCVAIEQQQAFPGRLHGAQVCPACKQPTIREGGVANFRTGMGFGLWLGIIATLAIPYTVIHPVRWKKIMLDGMPKEKDASRVRALQLFPKAAEALTRKKDHGRADALLIAECLRRGNGR